MIVCENLLSSSVDPGRQVIWENGINHFFFLSGTHKFYHNFCYFNLTLGPLLHLQYMKFTETALLQSCSYGKYLPFATLQPL